MARGYSRTASAPPITGGDQRSFEAFVAFVDRLFYMCIAALALCVASMLVP